MTFARSWRMAAAHGWVRRAAWRMWMASRVTPESRLNGVEIWSLVRGTDGSLLVGTGQQGVWRRDSAGAWQNLSGANPLKGNVFTLWAEKGGRVWAGTEQGLFFYEKGSWQPFDFGDGDVRPASLRPGRGSRR